MVRVQIQTIGVQEYAASSVTPHTVIETFDSFYRKIISNSSNSGLRQITMDSIAVKSGPTYALLLQTDT